MCHTFWSALRNLASLPQFGAHIVLAMTDQITPTLAMLRGKAVPLRLGHLGVRNRSQLDIETNKCARVSLKGCWELQSSLQNCLANPKTCGMSASTWRNGKAPQTARGSYACLGRCG